jgi:hypothetical protein
MRIWIQDLVNPRSGIPDTGWKNSHPGSWIRDKHPGSAALHVVKSLRYLLDGEIYCIVLYELNFSLHDTYNTLPLCNQHFTGS